MSGEEITKKKKPRMDKGNVQATKRDLHCVEWIAEQYGARFDQVQKLMGRFPNAEKPFKKDGVPGESTVKDTLGRWRRAGWIEYKRVLADGRGFAWVTKRGLELVGLDEIYTAKMPAATRLTHIYAVNKIRFMMDGKEGVEWESERRYRSKLEMKKGKTLGAIPDGIIRGGGYGTIAIEVEISPKKPAELFEKVVRLVRDYELNLKGDYIPRYSSVWFYVPSPAMKTAVDAAISKLKPDEQERVATGVLSL